MKTKADQVKISERVRLALANTIGAKRCLSFETLLGQPEVPVAQTALRHPWLRELAPENLRLP